MQHIPYTDLAFFRAPFRPVPMAGLGGPVMPYADVSDFMAPYRRGFYGPPQCYGYQAPCAPWQGIASDDEEEEKSKFRTAFLAFVLGIGFGIVGAMKVQGEF